MLLWPISPTRHAPHFALVAAPPRARHSYVLPGVSGYDSGLVARLASALLMGEAPVVVAGSMPSSNAVKVGLERSWVCQASRTALRAAKVLGLSDIVYGL
jgi:hypothetical protein